MYERTRLRFVTEGLLVRRLLDDPRLDGIGALVLVLAADHVVRKPDEFREACQRAA